MEIHIREEDWKSKVHVVLGKLWDLSVGVLP